MGFVRFKHQMLRPFERLGFLYVGRSSSRLQDFIHRLHPEEVDIPLVRMGDERDGGYLVPDDLAGIAALFSPGVAQNSSFKRRALQRA